MDIKLHSQLLLKSLLSERKQSMENKEFGRLLKAGINSIATCEGKTAPVVEDELGEKLGLTGYAIQRYKVGYIPPEPETLEVIAEAAVKRGFLNKEWLQKFLHAGRYPVPDRLINKLFTSVIDRHQPDKVLNNLPTPTYSKFVMRQKPFNEVMNGLFQRVSVVLITSLGGMGKTCLAREIAYRCLYMDNDLPKFDAAVWVSDKGREGTTNLNYLLDEIARTLDYPGFTILSNEDKKQEIDNLLRRQRVLIIIDNFETITDSLLVSWLLKLPEPSKAIVTSREYSRAFRNCTYVVELHGMDENETKELVTNRLQMLGIERLLNDWSQMVLLVDVTGGNPMAIEIALGYIKYQRKPINEIIDEIYLAKGELFDYLFSRCWDLISNEERSLLMSMYLFPFGAYSEALSAINEIKGFTLDTVLSHLTDLSLLDVHQEDIFSKPHYSLHSLVRLFVKVKLNEYPSFEAMVKDNWINWNKKVAAKIGFCWNDIEKLKLLDPEGERENIEAFLEWAFENKHYSDVIQITKDIRYYYYVRGIWATKNNLIRAEAAKILGDKNTEFEALVYHINIASKQNNTNEVEIYLPRLDELAQSGNITRESMIDFRHASALYYLASHNFEKAQNLWEQNLNEGNLSPHSTNANRRWLAVCLYGRGHNDEAMKLFDELRKDAQRQNFARGVVSAETYLSAIELDEGNAATAKEKISQTLELANKIKDKRAVAELSLLLGKCNIKVGDLSEARNNLSEAVDGFERLGLQNKLIEAREMLANIIDVFSEGD